MSYCAARSRCLDHSVLQTSTELTSRSSQIVFDWKVNNLKELFAREGSEPILVRAAFHRVARLHLLTSLVQSKPFDLERWRVVFYPRSASCQDEHVCALYIQAVPSPEDVMLANAERARLPRPAVADAATWKRAETKYTLSVRKHRDLVCRPPT